MAHPAQEETEADIEETKKFIYEQLRSEDLKDASLMRRMRRVRKFAAHKLEMGFPKAAAAIEKIADELK